jgi:lipoprotein-releasing system ATP-binding protein
VPTSGTVRLDGIPYVSQTPDELAAVRNRQIGFVFQFHHLLREFTALENVMMPLLVEHTFPTETMRQRAHDLLDRMGLAQWENNLANNMSGGQQQRVAIARALAMKPALVLADEPTGNLDTKSAEAVFKLMRHVNKTSGTTFLLVTHNMELARQCDHIVEVVDGKIARAATHGS